MYPYIGKRKPGSTIFIPWHAFTSDDPSASATITGLAVTDIEVYKDGSMTQRSSDAGYSLVDTDGIDLDGTTGIHGVSINVADNTDPGFWTAGSDYVVTIASITIDGATINFIPVRFTLGYDGSFHETSIATLAGQTSFTLTTGPADNDALNGCKVIVHDVASAVQVAIGYISDYVGSTRTVTLAADPGIFTMAAGDNISIFMPDNVVAVNNLITAGANLQAAASNYSVTRGLAGTALPAAAADAAGGLPISDAGALDLDALLAELDAANIPTDIDTLLTRLSAARAGYLDELGAANIPADIDTLLGRIIGTLAAGTHTAQSGDSYPTINTNLDAAISTIPTANENRDAILDDATRFSGADIALILAAFDSIANVGAATQKPAASYVLTTGVQSSGTFASTEELDGTNHEHTDTAGAMDLYYEFNIGSGIPSEVVLNGYLSGVNDSLEVYGYDWISTSWKRIGTMVGKVATTNDVLSFKLFVSMVGTGADLGKVRFRLTDGAFTLTTATLAIDQVYCSFSPGTTGYENGAIWLDTNASNTNTVPGIDGVSTNPVSTIAAVVTLAASTGLHRIQVAPGSSVTLASSFDNYAFLGGNWTLALGGQSISGAYIEGADITGIATGASQPTFRQCHFGAVTLPPSVFNDSGFGVSSGQFTAGSTGEYLFKHCYSMVPGSGTPNFVFTGLGPSTGINNRGWTGGSNYTLDSDCTLSHEVLAGGGQTITTGGASIEVRGVCRALTLVLSAAETAQFSGITGPITLSGTTTATVNLYGVSASLSDTTSAATVNDNTVSNVNARTEMDSNSTELAKIGTIPALDGAGQTIGEAIAKIADDNGGADFDATTDSLQAIRDRGDAAWITGGGGGITDIINIQPLIPNDIDLADTAAYRIGLMLFNSLDDLPSTGEITPGTISIDRKAIGGTTWSAVVTDAACSEIAGLIYYDEVFDSGTTYAEGDSIRITFKSQVVTVAANNYEIIGATGRMFYTKIRQTMRGTDGANTTVPDAAGTAAGLHSTTDGLIGGLNDFDAATTPVEIRATGGSAGKNAEELVDDICDEPITAATHNVATSLARRIRDIASDIVITGTSPDTGGTANTLIRIELDGDASSVDGSYDPATIVITGGTGAGQTRQIFEYDGTNKYAYVNRDWKVIPDSTSVYTIVGNPGNGHVNEGVATGGGANTITLNSLASSTNDLYNGQLIMLVAGTGQDQVALITDYDGATKIATVAENWATQPVNDATVYMILPAHVHEPSEIRAEIDSNSTQLAAIVADTNEIQAELANGGRTDLLIDSIITHLTQIKGAGWSSETLVTIEAAILALNDFDPTSETVDVGALNGSSAAAVLLALSAGTMVSGEAQTGTLSTTQMSTDLSEVTDDHYNGRLIVWTSGALQNQYTAITDYTGTGGILTFTAVTEIPANGDTFIIV